MKLHNDIMNIQINDPQSGLRSGKENLSYKIGHRDARHAAAEISLKYGRALEMAMFALHDIAEFGRVTSDDCSEYCADHLQRVKQILEE